MESFIESLLSVPVTILEYAFSSIGTYGIGLTILVSLMVLSLSTKKALQVISLFILLCVTGYGWMHMVVECGFGNSEGFACAGKYLYPITAFIVFLNFLAVKDKGLNKLEFRKLQMYFSLFYLIVVLVAVFSGFSEAIG